MGIYFLALFLMALPDVALPSAGGGCIPEEAKEGQKLFEEGRFQEAERKFRLAVQAGCGEIGAAEIVNLGASLRELGRYQEAASLYRAALPSGERAGTAGIHLWNGLAVAEDHLGHFTEAEGAYRRAVELLREQPDAPSRVHVLVLGNFGHHWLRRGRIQEAEDCLEQARKQSAWREQPSATVAINLAELRRLQGRRKEAEKILRGLISGAELPVATRGAARSNLGSLVAARGDRKEAFRLWEAALEDWRSTYGPRHPLIAKLLNNMAASFYAAKQYDEAEPLYRQAMAMDRDLLGPMHPTLAVHYNNLGALLDRQGDRAQAEEMYRSALKIFEQHPDSQAALPREAIKTLGNLASLLVKMRREEEAVAAFRRMTLVLRVAAPDDEQEAGEYLESYETLLRRRKEPAEAEKVAVLAMKYKVRAALRQEKE